MQQRQLGPFTVSAIGLGCMNLSHAYGKPPSSEVGEALIHKALDIGVTLFDTAAIYGFAEQTKNCGANKNGSHCCEPRNYWCPPRESNTAPTDYE